MLTLANATIFQSFQTEAHTRLQELLTKQGRRDYFINSVEFDDAKREVLVSYTYRGSRDYDTQDWLYSYDEFFTLAELREDKIAKIM